MGRKKDNTPLAASMLMSFVAEIEELEEEKRDIAASIKDAKARAKSAGFDTKALNQILKERRMDAGEREEFAALVDIYRAGLGMLNGSPLGDAARRKLMGEGDPAADPQAPGSDGEADDGGEQPPAWEAPQVDVETARAQGGEAAKAGKRIIDNPFVAGDPRRAAWDEGWCAAMGTDGMEIPPAWRRKPKRKDGEGDGDGGEGEA